MSILQNHIKYYVISSKMGKPALILGTYCVSRRP